jgi:hypothetical protein
LYDGERLFKNAMQALTGDEYVLWRNGLIHWRANHPSRESLKDALYSALTE